LASETKFKKTEIGMIPEDWDVGELKDFCSKIGSGATPRGGSNVYVNSGIAFIRSQNVYDEGFKTEGLVFIQDSDAKKLNSVEVKKNDILFNITGDSICRCCIVPDSVLPARVNQHVSIIRTNNKLYYKFLYCYLCLNRTKETLLSFDAGGTRKAITKGNLEKLLLPLPSYIEQTRIGDFIGLINDKIDLNHQMNSTLEQIAQTLFKHWFIDFEFPDENGNPYKSSGGRMVDSELGEIPEGWKIGVLGDFCEIIMGQSPPGKTYNEEGKGLPFHQGITDFGFRFPSRRVYCTEPKRIAEKGDVLLSVRAPVGSLNVADQKYAIGRGLAALKLKRDHGSYLFYLMKATQSRWNIFESEGTVFGSIGKSDIYNFKTIIPPQNLISKFNDLIKPLDERIACNEKNNHILSLTRDSLLPKLMSGKIRVQV